MPGRDALLGGAAAQCAEVLAFGHLLDRVKVEQQVATSGGQRVRATECVRRLYARGGVAEMYRGMMPNLAQAGLKGASRWGFLTASIHLCDAVLPTHTRQQQPSAYNCAVGVTTGALETTLVSCPFESLKVWQMTRGKDQPSLRIAVARDPRMLWRGWSAQFFKQTITWATFLIVYEKVRQAALAVRHGQQLSTVDKAGVGLLTGAFATLVHAPADAAKTLVQSASAPRQQYGFAGAVRSLVMSGGASALFAGMAPKLARNCVSTTITVITIDYFGCLPKGMEL